MTRHLLRTIALLASLTVAIAAMSVPARAGALVDQDFELRKLHDLQQELDALPAYLEAADLKAEISALIRQRKRLAVTGGFRPIDQVEIEEKIDALELQIQGLSKIIIDFENTYAEEHHTRYFPSVKYRIAVFTFDDPQDTGLGNDIALLLTKKALFSTRVTSFAVVNYRQGTAPTGDAPQLAYFDKVDALTQNQGFVLAIWGRIARNGSGVTIDTFIQVPADADAGPYVRRVRLPENMGNGVLTARLKPDRIKVQSLNLDADGVASVREAAKQLAILRASPSRDAAPVATLQEYNPFRIDNMLQDWAHLEPATGNAGWTSVDTFCTGACRTLLDTTVVAIDTLALTAGLPTRSVPETATREVSAFNDQLTALNSLDDNPDQSIAIAEKWIDRDRPKDAPLPPGGAAFANLHAVAEIKAAIKSQSEPLDRDLVKTITNDLAKASVADPSDVDVLNNLAVLFGYLGDEKREALAAQIAKTLGFSDR